MKTKHKKLCTTLAGALFLISSGAAYADTGQPPPEKPPTQPVDQQQIISQLLQHIEALEKKLGTMETKPPAEERLAKIESKIEQVREETSAANIDNSFALVARRHRLAAGGLERCVLRGAAGCISDPRVEIKESYAGWDWYIV